jgi:hypothetical protein
VALKDVPAWGGNVRKVGEREEGRRGEQGEEWVGEGR